MSKILVITGATGKKSGGYFAHIVGNNLERVKLKFPDGIRVIVRKTTSTKDLKKCIIFSKGNWAEQALFFFIFFAYTNPGETCV